MKTSVNSANSMKKEHSTWLKRIGVVGFLFFLIKGIIWLVALWAGVNLF